MKQIEQIKTYLKEWSNNDKNIKYAIIIGSTSHNEADEYSDIDIMVFCKNPNYYLETKEWLNEISPFQICYTQNNISEGVPMRRIVFKNKVEIDFTPINYKEISKAHLFCKLSKTKLYSIIPTKLKVSLESKIIGFNMYTSKGREVIADKNNLDIRVKFISETFPYGTPKITKFLFEENYNYFYHQIIREAIRLRRGEIYASKECAEYFSKGRLREMIEWYMKLQKGLDYETYYNGKKLEYWCDNKIVLKMKNIYGNLNFESSKEALYQTFTLYNELAIIVAEKIKYDTNKFKNTKIFTNNYINEILITKLEKSN